MIPDDVRDEILRRLRGAEAEHGVRILFAIESGSRAWGFASPDSDYDVRFVYAHPPSWYQSVDLEERRDVIEYPIVDDIDLNGWDVRKALRLFWKSNPAFVEWIQSPVTYLERGGLRDGARRLLADVYAPGRGVHHYRNMARANHRRYLRTPTVRLKKYFYVLRPLLAARWIARAGAAPPIEFERLLAMLDGDRALLDAIGRLLDDKRAAPERGLAPAVPVLDAFIEAELASDVVPAHRRERAAGAMDALNTLFRRVLAEHG
ncbi:MAG TPA: nucleotidyltransferase domain-containing protein [Lysobacter sp.]